MTIDPPLDVPREQFIEYLKTLKDGDEVIDYSESAMYMTRGVIYTAKDGTKCVRWTLGERFGKDAGKTMGTSVTWGTRKIFNDHETN